MHPMDFQKAMTVAVIDDSEDIKFGSTAVWCSFCNIGIRFSIQNCGINIAFPFGKKFD